MVGGSDSGGIVVREGQGLDAKQVAERLSTGSYVEEVALVGNRLSYRLLSGAGPEIGWITTRTSERKLVERIKAAPEKVVLEKTDFVFRVSPSTPVETECPQRIPVELKRTLGRSIPKPGDIKLNEPGDHFKLRFPHTEAQLLDEDQFGSLWLTRAFRLAGTLAENNAVCQIVGAKSFSGGGAAVKVILSVQYLVPDDTLHTELFVKLPLDPSHKNRELCIQLAMEGKECLFNRFFGDCLPFRIPKFYFADLSMKTTNWILITEKLPFRSRWEQCEPFAIEPPLLKGMDWARPDMPDKYLALFRKVAMMVAWAHSGKLGPQLKDFFPSPKPNFQVCQTLPASAIEGFWPQVVQFVLTHAKVLFPADIANAKYLHELKQQVVAVVSAGDAINRFVTADMNLWGYAHLNPSIDNAFFWRDAEGLQDCGLLDWGGADSTFLLNCFVGGGGALQVASADIRVPYTDLFVKEFCSSLEKFGGPILDADGTCLRVALLDMVQIMMTMTTLEQGFFGNIYDRLPKDQWKAVTGIKDPIFTEDSVDGMMLRGHVVAFVEGLKTWKGRRYHEVFSKWRGKVPL